MGDIEAKIRARAAWDKLSPMEKLTSRMPVPPLDEKWRPNHNLWGQACDDIHALLTLLDAERAKVRELEKRGDLAAVTEERDAARDVLDDLGDLLYGEAEYEPRDLGLRLRAWMQEADELRKQLAIERDAGTLAQTFGDTERLRAENAELRAKLEEARQRAVRWNNEDVAAMDRLEATLAAVRALPDVWYQLSDRETGEGFNMGYKRALEAAASELRQKLEPCDATADGSPRQT